MELKKFVVGYIVGMLIYLGFKWIVLNEFDWSSFIIPIIISPVIYLVVKNRSSKT